MPRVKRSTRRKDRRKKILKAASGYFGGKSRLHRFAKLAVEKAGIYAFRDRRVRKREFRRLWVVRINAAARLNQLSYSQFMRGLKSAGVTIDRKVLADIAFFDAAAFKALVDRAKLALSPA